MNTEIEVHILGRSFRFYCSAEVKERLLQAAHFLNDRLIDVEKKKKSLMFDNMVIEVALNITHELLLARSEHEKMQKQLDQDMKLLQDSIEAALTRNVTAIRSTQSVAS